MLGKFAEGFDRINGVMKATMYGGKDQGYIDYPFLSL
jgi:hypothetical protein